MKKSRWITFIMLVCLVLTACVAFAGCGGDGGDGGETAGASVTLNETTLSLTTRETFKLTATGEGVTGKYKWETTDAKIVSVEPSGKTATVTARAPGTATVTAITEDEEGNEVKATCAVTVQDAPLYVFLPEGKLVLRKNESATVKAFYDEALTGEFSWESADAAIAKVEFQGNICIVTALQIGSTTVTVKYAGHESSFELICGVN